MAYILDNNRAIQGEGAHGLPVYAPAHLAEERKGFFVVIVMSKKYYDVIRCQLSDMGLTENTDFYDAVCDTVKVPTGGCYFRRILRHQVVAFILTIATNDSGESVGRNKI